MEAPRACPPPPGSRVGLRRRPLPAASGRAAVLARSRALAPLSLATSVGTEGLEPGLGRCEAPPANLRLHYRQRSKEMASAGISPDQGGGKSRPLAWEMAPGTGPLTLIGWVLSVAHQPPNPNPNPTNRQL